MYLCSICNKVFEIEDDIAKHSLKCWREHNPYHRSTPAPHGKDIIEKKVNKEVFNFFSSLQERG